MNEHEFWDILETAGIRSIDQCDSMVQELLKILQQLPVEQIQSFHAIFVSMSDLAYRRDLQAAAFIINASGSEDGFTDFRSWLIGRGKAVFYNALANPDSLADIELAFGSDAECEQLGYAAIDAFDLVTGQEMPLPTRPNIPISGEKLSYKHLAKFFPRLWQKYKS